MWNPRAMLLIVPKDEGDKVTNHPPLSDLLVTNGYGHAKFKSLDTTTHNPYRLFVGCTYLSLHLDVM